MRPSRRKSPASWLDWVDQLYDICPLNTYSPPRKSPSRASSSCSTLTQNSNCNTNSVLNNLTLTTTALILTPLTLTPITLLHPCPSTFLCCNRLDTEPYDCEAQHQHTQAAHSVTLCMLMTLLSSSRTPPMPLTVCQAL